MSTSTAQATTGRRTAFVLAIIVSTQLLFGIDSSVVTIALPSIGADLGLDVVGQSWVQSAYVLAFGGLLLLGGRLGDLFGRRQAVVAGVLVFTAASLAGGLAPSSGWLITARALQGAGAALAAPNAMALLMVTFAPGPARNRALSIYSAVLGAAGSVGLVLGGLLATVDWRWVLLVNLPIGIAVLALAPRLLPRTARSPGRLDLLGTATSAGGVTLLVFGLTRAADHGWGDTVALVAIGAAVVVLAAFVAVELRVREPVLPMGLVLDRIRGSGYLAAMLMAAAMFGEFFLLTQYLQRVVALDALGAGLALLPMMGSMLVIVRLVPRLLARVRPSSLAAVGTLLFVIGAGWLAAATTAGISVVGILGPTVLIGIGGGFSFVPLSSSILAAVRPDQAGAASGTLQVVQYVGTALGVAVPAGVVGAVSRTGAGVAASIGAGGLAPAGVALLAFALLLVRRTWDAPPLSPPR